MNHLTTFRVERASPLPSDEAAEGIVAALADLSHQHLPGFLAYGRTQSGVVHVCRANVAKWLTKARLTDFGVPTMYTHGSVLLDAPRDGRPMGGLSLAVGTRKGLGRGIVFAVRLDEARAAKVDAGALVDACANLDVDLASFGSVRWARGETPLPVRASTPSSAEPAMGQRRPPSAEELRQLIDDVSLSIDEYAHIRATVAVLPTQEDAIWCTYGVFDAASRRQIEAQMDARFASDSRASAAFRERVEAWLRSTLGNVSR